MHHCECSRALGVAVLDANCITRERVMGVQVGQVFQRLVTSAGAKFKMSVSVEKATPSGKALFLTTLTFISNDACAVADPTKVGGIQLKSGEIIPADLVILGVGVAPETRYIKDESLLLKDRSLEVDDHYRVKGVQDAYAVGKCLYYYVNKLDTPF